MPGKNSLDEVFMCVANSLGEAKRGDSGGQEGSWDVSRLDDNVPLLNHGEMSHALKERYKFVTPSDTLCRPCRAWRVTGGLSLGPCPRLYYARLSGAKMFPSLEVFPSRGV